MTGFHIPGPSRAITCTSCDDEASVRRPADLCDLCQLYSERPELAPGYWT